MTAAAAGLPPRLAEIAEDFAAMAPPERRELLLEMARDLPPLPQEHMADRARLEQVHECQTPLFLAVTVTATGTVRLTFDAPAEAPTTRGFAGILYQGLDGESTEAVLAVPGDFSTRLGLAEVISPLRLRGMAAMLARIKRQVREQLG